MSDNNDEFEGVLDENIRKQLRSQAKALKDAETKIREAELRATYTELGIPNEGAAKLFRDTYSGDPSPEAVKAAASQYGDAVLKPAPPSELELERQKQLEALSRINGADGTAAPEGQSMLDELLAKLTAAKNSPEEMDAILASPEAQALKNQPIAFM